ncbi:maleylpyruvate isomerase family mycothiol-dependent enzyme [Kitasatospora sp. NPDC088134]|uniref:maleylpyruvate isomerase family mycothiol-dependent enzyme n=1 Tax=Kitasatospora sp. NPDC088134 TaxID=3364071 RepID=UPI0037F2DE5A
MSDSSTAAAQLRATVESTDLLLHTLRELRPEDVPAPSALPGWTRGHVLTHLARNADSLVNLLNGARTGQDIPQYPSAEARDAAIEAGAGRPLAEQVADVRDSQQRFLDAAALLDPEHWSAEVKHRSGYVFPAWQLPVKRLAELEYHHVDLNAGYTPAHWPEDFATAEFRRLGGHFGALAGLPAVRLIAEDAGLEARLGDPEAAPELTVEGPVRALTGWLSGRSDGDGLQVHRAGEGLVDPRSALPQLPPMG